MKVYPLSIEGVFGIKSDATVDDRGAFFRIWENQVTSIGPVFTQVSVTTNPVKGTLRGLHFQEVPFSEDKVVHSLTGSIYDVVLDLRSSSPTFKQHLTIELGLDKPFQGILIPKGFAHGYMTLEPNSTLVYLMNSHYSPEHAKGVRWDDSLAGITWPRDPVLISARDRNWPALQSETKFHV